jgi:hypothetical protein
LATSETEVGDPGVRWLMESKSSIWRDTVTSRAIASRCSTAVVQPPVAMIPAIALWNEETVR